MNSPIQVQFELKHLADKVLIQFSCAQDIISPDCLKSLQPPDSVKEKFAHKGVVLSGKGPIWLYGFLVHLYHSTLWVATFGPRLQGAVVVESHTPGIHPGDIISFDK